MFMPGAQTPGLNKWCVQQLPPIWSRYSRVSCRTNEHADKLRRENARYNIEIPEDLLYRYAFLFSIHLYDDVF